MKDSSLKYEIDSLVEKNKTPKDKPKAKKKQFGAAKGKIKLAPDFDEPLEDFKDYM